MQALRCTVKNNTDEYRYARKLEYTRSIKTNKMFKMYNGKIEEAKRIRVVVKKERATAMVKNMEKF